MAKIPTYTHDNIPAPGWYWFSPDYPDAGGPRHPHFVKVHPEDIEVVAKGCKRYQGRYAGPVEPPEMEEPSTFSADDKKELVYRRSYDEQVIRIINRAICRCLSADCTIHGAYDPADISLMAYITANNKMPKPGEWTPEV